MVEEEDGARGGAAGESCAGTTTSRGGGAEAAAADGTGVGVAFEPDTGTGARGRGAARTTGAAADASSTSAIIGRATLVRPPGAADTVPTELGVAVVPTGRYRSSSSSRALMRVVAVESCDWVAACFCGRREERQVDELKESQKKRRRKTHPSSVGELLTDHGDVPDLLTRVGVPGELRVVRDEVARLGLAQGAQALEVVDLVLEVGRDGDERVELRDLLCEAAGGRGRRESADEVRAGPSGPLGKGTHLSTSSLSAPSLARVCAKMPTTLRFSTRSRSASRLASPSSRRCSSSSPSNRSASSWRRVSSSTRLDSSWASCAVACERSERAVERDDSDAARSASRRGISSLTARSSLRA